MALAKQFEVEVIVPEGLTAGDVFKVTVETPELPKQGRGQVAGIPLEEMTDEQLKVELVNAKSVLYKAKKRDADAATIEANQARVDAAEAEKAKRKAASVPAGTTVENNEESTNVEEESVDTDTANEI